MNMESIMNFLADNYKWFMIAAGVLLVALIGFLVMGKKKKGNESAPAPIPQNDFNQMGTMQQMQAQPQVPVTPEVAQQPVTEAPQVSDTIFTGAPVNNVEEEKLVIEAPGGSLNNNANLDTLGVDAPSIVPETPEIPVVNATTADVPPVVKPTPVAAPTELVLETPTVEPVAAPVMETPAVESAVSPMPAVETPVMESAPVVEPTPTVEPMVATPTPVMEAPVMESAVVQEPLVAVPAMEEMPISMTPEAPAPAPTPAPAPMPTVATEAPAAPVYQNTIQQ